MSLTRSTSREGLLDAQLELWHTCFAFMKSMALKSALDLGVANAIHDNGGTATLPQIASKVTLHPSKIPYLRRLMRVLATTGIFSAKHPKHGDDELVYGLTPASQLLVGSSSLAPFISLPVDEVFVSPFLGLGSWLQHENSSPTLFETTHGKTTWYMNDHNPTFSARFNEGMACDSGFVMDIVIKNCSDIFQGLSSLIDVAGGLGGAALAIATAFPDIQCSVLDLPHVTANAPASTNVKYIGGDMFDAIPSANAVFLKWVLHDWGDADCVKILKNCKKAIPHKDAGGKVIVLEIVIGGESSSIKHKETQVLFDLFIMAVDGAERDEKEWRRIIFEAGFSDYKIRPVLGVRSIIEMYP